MNSLTFKQRFMIALVLPALAWLVYLLDLLLIGIDLRSWGILPRQLSGLFPGVLAAPLLHGNLWHLIANSLPLLVLMLLASFHGIQRLLRTVVIVVIGSGLLVWLLGREAYHIGASGLIFGLWAYLLAYGFFKRDLKAIAIAFLVLLFYGGMWFGLLFGRPGISIEAHFFGALTGVGCAFLDGRRKRPDNNR